MSFCGPAERKCLRVIVVALQIVRPNEHIRKQRYITAKNVLTKGTKEWVTFDVTETVRQWLMNRGQSRVPEPLLCHCIIHFHLKVWSLPS